MNLFLYITRFLYRIRWWVISVTAIVTLLGILLTQNLSKKYEVTTTVYTGIVSGVDIENMGAVQRVDMGAVDNSMDNLMTVITSRATLRNVSIRLFAQHMMYGDPNRDNQYIKAENFRKEYAHVPQVVRDLIDKSSEERTLSNLNEYQKDESGNYLYDLFNYGHYIYSYSALSKISAKRVGNSDMLEIYYSHPDPGVAYNTVKLLYDEFVKQYKSLRFDEVDDVIKYFENELALAKLSLRMSEDSLTRYNINKKVINYDEQTRAVAALTKEHEISYETVLLDYYSSQREMEILDKYVDESVKAIQNNKEYLRRLKDVTDISTRIAQINTLGMDTLANNAASLENLKKLSANAEKGFLDFSIGMGMKKYTKEGMTGDAYVTQWFEALVQNAKAESQLKVLENRKKEIDKNYTYYSPIGTTIKRQEREIGFHEQTYLSILNSLNAAKLRRKSLQLYSASLKVINPPLFPLTSKPTQRKAIILLLFFGSMFLVIGYFALLELLDRTLKNKYKAELLTGGKVIGAYPHPSKYRYKVYNKDCENIAVKTLANTILNYYNINREQNVKLINFISVEEEDEMQKIAEQISKYFESVGMSVRTVMSGKEFMPDAKEYLLATDVNAICNTDNEDLAIIVHPSLKSSMVPSYFINNASLTLFVASCTSVWSDTDQLFYDSIMEKSKNNFLPICLIRADREVLEVFTGLLPPYTPMRRFMYKLLHFGLTSKS